MGTLVRCRTARTTDDGRSGVGHSDALQPRRGDQRCGATAFTVVPSARQLQVTYEYVRDLAPTTPNFDEPSTPPGVLSVTDCPAFR
ncbi:MAG: hypothetical protein RJB61_1118 [Actinomycetota bacterium]